MITLQSIRIRNFRAVAEATFKPLEQGITGISGSNGAGKTTFLSATMFALFGVRPPDASLSSLRREGSTGECSVSVVFKHLNQQVEVIRELKGSNNRAIVNIYVDGVPQTVTSVGAADQWIAQRLGVDATGFMTAFVVRQKELDQLITARPAERKQIIEKLAGIDTINFALKSAREDENQAKKVLATLPGSEQAVEEAEGQLNLLNDKMEQIDANRTKLQQDQLVLTTNQRKLQQQFEVLKDAELKTFKSASTLENLAKELKSLREQSVRLKYLDDVDEEDSVESLRERYVELTAELTKKTKEVNDLRVEHQTNIAEVKSLQIIVDNAKSVIEGNPPNSFTRSEIEKQIEEIEKTIHSKNDRSNILLSRITDLETSVSLLSHSAECPTCHTDLADPQSLVNNFLKDIEAYKEEINFIDEALLSLNEDLGKAKTELFILIEVTSAQETLLESANKIDEIQAVDHEVQIGILESEIASLEVERSSVAELGHKAKGFAEDREARAGLDAKIATNLKETETLELEMENNPVTFSPEALADLKQELLQVQSKVDANTPLLENLTSDKSSTESRLTMAKVAYKSNVEQWKRKQDLMYQQQRFALTTDLIDKFRSDSISSLAPELSEYATSLISDMTNGDFTEVLLDEEFNASIVDSRGTTRPVSWLSGGEVSAVALALRIAIGFLITSGNPELLWLDEVLTAQDADRRTAMLSMIRGLPIDQIIMINHTSEAADIVDKTVSLIKDPENGSYIAED